MIKQENLIFIEESMKHSQVMRLVEKESQKIEFLLPDVTSFEHTCYVSIGKELKKGKTLAKHVVPMAKHYIKRAAARHLRRTRYKPTVCFSTLSTFDEDGEELEFEVLDVLADVEQELINNDRYKEIVTYLAEGDDLQNSILNAWTMGYNDSEVSRVLANSFNIKPSGMRRKVQRFKSECKKRLSVA